MSPTSYQTAPPREVIIATVLWSVKLRPSQWNVIRSRIFLLLQLRALASRNNLAGIDGLAVQLFFQNLPIFADQNVDAPCGLIFVHIHAVLVSQFPAPVAQQREGNANLVRPCFVCKRTIHAHTQDLGVGGFQLCQILLEVFHLLRSTTGKSKDVEREHHILLAAVLAERHVVEFMTIKILELEIWRGI